MLIDEILESFPKNLVLKSGFDCVVRPLEATDEAQFYGFFQAVPEPERMFIKHRVSDATVIHQWCTHADFGRNLPLMAVKDTQVIGCATLHQHLGGWKRHIGRVSVLVHPQFRGRGLARALVSEILQVSRDQGLEKVEAEFIGGQDAAMKVFALLGFKQLLRLEDYVKDMQANKHDYVLMGLELETDEEYAGMA